MAASLITLRVTAQQRARCESLSERSHAAIQWTWTALHPQRHFSITGPSVSSHHVCHGRIQFVCHGHELCPVATETLRVDTSVHDESPAGAASAFVPQSHACLALRHVEADVDDLHHQQMQQPTAHYTAVPRTGEAQCGAEIQTNEEWWFKSCCWVAIKHNTDKWYINACLQRCFCSY